MSLFMGEIKERETVPFQVNNEGGVFRFRAISVECQKKRFILCEPTSSALKKIFIL